MKRKILLIAILTIASFAVKAQDFLLNIEKTATSGGYNYFTASIITEGNEYPGGGSMQQGQVWFHQYWEPVTDAELTGVSSYYFSFKVPSSVTGLISAEFSDPSNGVTAHGDVYVEE